MITRLLHYYAKLRWGYFKDFWITFICTLSLQGTALAQPDPTQVLETQVKAITIRQQSQKTEEEWAKLKGELKVRYQSLKSEKKALEKDKVVISEQIKLLMHRQTEAERKITESARIGENLQGHLEGVIERLEESVGRGLPFLMQERTERIRRINNTMVQPDASIAEKCRQVMEALKIETEYGQTVEVYQETLRVDDSAASPAVVTDILRLGRLALFWRTPDGKIVGRWNRADGKWSVLPDKYRRPINDAMEMALKRRTVDMVKLPLGRIAVQ